MVPKFLTSFPNTASFEVSGLWKGASDETHPHISSLILWFWHQPKVLGLVTCWACVRILSWLFSWLYVGLQIRKRIQLTIAASDANGDNAGLAYDLTHFSQP